MMMMMMIYTENNITHKLTSRNQKLHSIAKQSPVTAQKEYQYRFNFNLR